VAADKVVSRLRRGGFSALILAASLACAAPESAIRWVPIAAGSLAMGCTPGDPDCTAGERPVAQVQIPQSFEMAATETTDEQYTECVRAGACRPAGYRAGWRPWHRRSDLPVVWVSWKDARQFCEWSGGRLPSQAEWELAARGGEATWRYPWGNELPTTDPGAMNGARYAAPQRGAVGRGPVMAYGASPRGLYDLAGNVWEWVADDWSAGHGGVPTDGSAYRGGDEPTEKVVRGGSSFDPAASLRVSVVGRSAPENRLENIGFRCVRDLPRSGR
jgi:formylglycine-generating enzyme required for sulfatase activity